MIVLAVCTGVVGFALGYFGFKIRVRWCPNCGSTKSCPLCDGRLA